LAAAGTVVGVLFLLAARTGRRLWTAFASLLANFAPTPWRFSAALQFSCVVLGGLIILRTSNEAVRKAGDERRQRRAEERASRGGTAPAGRRGRTTAAPAGPVANKRYTPPKPKPKRPPAPPPTKDEKRKEAERASKRSEETT
jgi:hypothetical protein